MYKLKLLAVKYSVLVVMVILIIMFAFLSPVFLTWQNIGNLINQNTYFIIASVGLAFVMIGGGIDLSVGYQMSLVGVVTAILMTELHLPVWVSVSIGLILGSALGGFIGLIITKFKVFPLIVTLAMSTVYQGISYQISQARTFRQFPASFRILSTGSLFGIRYDVYLALIVVLAAVYIFKSTYLGRHILAVGGNNEAARLSGIPVKKITIFLYAICGFLFALATMDMISKSNTTASNFGPGTEFTCMTAAIIGGVSFKGGKGNMGGLVIGVFVLQILGNGMQLAGWGTYSQYIVKGLILLLAIAFDGIELKPDTKMVKASLKGAN
jgi:ribose/xylose/arabinose/galactoside ABC-type transport system permease subunit